MSDDIWKQLPTRDSAGMKRMPMWDSLTCEMYLWERSPGRCIVGFDKDCADHHLAFILDPASMTFKYTCEHILKGAEIMKGWVV